jgi:hypothetical protein
VAAVWVVPALDEIEDRHPSVGVSLEAVAVEQLALDYRWHDLRHSFVSRLAENPHVSEETIRALAGHVSRKMLERYSHIRTHAKRAAIASLEHVSDQRPEPDSEVEGAQKEAQSDASHPRSLS